MSAPSIAKVPHVHAEVIKAWADGEQIQMRTSPDKEWVDMTLVYPHWDTAEYRVKPEKIYPVTQMTPSDFIAVGNGIGDNSMAANEAVANAALRHAIDADQVVLMAEVQEVARNLNKRRYERAERALLSAGFEDLGGQEWKPPLGKAPHFIEVHDPKRDMAIAVAVRDHIVDGWPKSSARYFPTYCGSLDLATIIAKVRP